MYFSYADLRGPPGYVLRSASVFQRAGCLKNYDWQNFIKCTGAYLLHGLVPGEEEYKLIKRLLGCLETEYNNTVVRSNNQALAELTELQQTSADFERFAPKTELVMMVHELSHFPKFRLLWGPGRGFWMYPYERFVGKIAWMVTNRRDLEVNLVRRYALSQFIKALPFDMVDRARTFAQTAHGSKVATDLGLAPGHPRPCFKKSRSRPK